MKKYYILLAIFSFGIIIMALASGAVDISFKEVFNIIISKFFKNKNFSNVNKIILLNIRLPRVLLAFLVGIGLSCSGVVFQAIFKNPMAEPYILGISSGAAFGATIVLIGGFSYSILGISMVSIGAFIGAIFATFLVFEIAKFSPENKMTTLLLAGVTLSFFLSAGIKLMMIFNKDSVEKIIFWTMGSLAGAQWNQVIISFIVIFLGFLIFLYYSRELNILLTGEETAISLGINVKFIQKKLLLVASLVAAIIVSVSGIIGFVGLIIPHSIRLIVGPNHKKLLPLTAFVGGIFLVLADLVARVIISPTEIPIGVITALIGAPYFIFLLLKPKYRI